ncbi:MAG: HlyD family secretion protein [Phycisphaerales bacterium]|nr:HlyD family secretion protein [Phycisphaerales bacterium]
MTKLLMIGVLALLPLAACSRGGEEPAGEAKGHGEGSKEPAKGPTNRVDIPGPVRSNLGITFATVESRAVAQTLRVPGRFELLPTARRESRAPLAGRVELLVEPNQRVEAGDVLYRLDSSTWRDLHERIGAAQARLDSMTPLRAAHRVHEETLSAKVKLWQERLAQLETIRAAGGGSADKFTEARATMTATQAELADVMEKDAELEATEKSLGSDLRSLEGRRGRRSPSLDVCARALRPASSRPPAGRSTRRRRWRPSCASAWRPTPISGPSSCSSSPRPFSPGPARAWRPTWRSRSLAQARNWPCPRRASCATARHPSSSGATRPTPTRSSASRPTWASLTGAGR